MKPSRMFRFSMLAITFLLAAGSQVQAQPEIAFNDYLAALKEMRWGDAERFWQPIVIDKSRRLGIVYTDVPAKYDCASPLMTALPAIRAGDLHISTTVVSPDSDTTRILVRIESATDSIMVTYFAEKSASGWQLTSPLYFYSHEWKIRRTAYADIYYADESLLNDYACRTLDDFVEAAGKTLGLSPDDFARLKRDRIDYFLCTRDDMRRLTGYDAQGMTDLKADAVVSQTLPHEHELTHLLVNYRLRQLPLYTLPLMQEGLATSLGGRWNKAPCAMRYMGYITLANDIGHSDDLLTYGGFNSPNVTAEVSYPISALFTGFLVETWGFDKYLNLYRTLSGSADQVRSYDARLVESIFEKAYGLPWMSIAAAFEDYWKKFHPCGVTPDTLRPMENPAISIDSAGVNISIRNSRDFFHFAVNLSSGAREGILLLNDGGDSVATAYRSELFDKSLPEETYRGEHVGVRFSADEVAVYDYLTNKLLASYIDGLSPVKGFRDSTSSTLHFAVSRDIMNGLDCTNARLIVR